MRTELQRQTARLNGAKSRGPITAAGKRRSSQNARRHGLYSRHVLALVRDAAPAPPHASPRLGAPDQPHRPEGPLCATPEEILHLAWLDYMRVAAREARFLTEEIARQRTLHPGESEQIPLTLAHSHLCDTGVTEALYRLHCAASRNWEIAIERFGTQPAARAAVVRRREFDRSAEAAAPRAENIFDGTNPAILLTKQAPPENAPSASCANPSASSPTRATIFGGTNPPRSRGASPAKHTASREITDRCTNLPSRAPCTPRGHRQTRPRFLSAVDLRDVTRSGAESATFRTGAFACPNALIRAGRSCG